MKTTGVDLDAVAAAIRCYPWTVYGHITFSRSEQWDDPVGWIARWFEYVSRRRYLHPAFDDGARIPAMAFLRTYQSGVLDAPLLMADLSEDLVTAPYLGWSCGLAWLFLGTSESSEFYIADVLNGSATPIISGDVLNATSPSSSVGKLGVDDVNVDEACTLTQQSKRAPGGATSKSRT